MADIEKLRRRAPNNRVYQQFLSVGQISYAKTFLACDLVVSFGTAGALLGLMGAAICAFGATVGVLPPGLTQGMLIFGFINMIAADVAGYVIWRMMRAEPTLAKDVRPNFGPMVWILIKEAMRFAIWSRAGVLTGQYGRCQVQLRLNKQGEVGVNFAFTLAPGETGVTSRGALGRWHKVDAANLDLRFGEEVLSLKRDKAGDWRFAKGAGREALAAAWSAPLDELALKADRDF
jgi:hypothetical protein